MLVQAAFAAIVIFQSDIRRALAHFGGRAVLPIEPAGGGRRDDRVVAVTALAAQKVGAIIAIERDIGPATTRWIPSSDADNDLP